MIEPVTSCKTSPEKPGSPPARIHGLRCEGRIAGFTLIELLVAITILAVVAVLGWRGLDGIVRARIALTENLDLTRAMQLSFAQMQSDCAQVMPDTAGFLHPTLLATQDSLMMVRSVNSDSQPTRAQVVTYRVRNGLLSRHESVPTRNLNELATAWQAATTSAAEVEALTLQSDVTGFAMRLWQKNGWRTPPSPEAAGKTSGAADPNNVAPTGLEVSLQLRGRNNVMRKIFLLGAV